jgi:hypothetical protein
MCGTFSYSTHYVPFMNYCGDNNMGLLEGTYLAMRNELKIGDETYKMRRGSKVRLYLPSTIAYGESGSQTEGGYEGQYSLDASKPLILDVEVLSAIKNPSELELDMVKSYIGWGTPWIQAVKDESEKTDENDDLKLKGLYYNHSYNPATDNTYNYRYMQPHLEGTNNPYVDSKKYNSGNMPFINQQINDILLERFGKGLEASERGEKNLVTKNGRADVWYVVRFLDGFVVDTNIAEIRELIFDEKAPTCEVFSYSPSDDEGKGESERQAIGAWYYCIPQMHYGGYGQIITTSGYAYGSAGVSASTSTSGGSYNAGYNALANLYNYYSMMGSAYYNPYSYYNYYNYYGGYNNYYDYEETTSTIETEIAPYTPLIFYVFVEPTETADE